MINLNNHPYHYGEKVPTAVAKGEHGRSFSLENESGYIVKRWSIDTVVFKDSEEERCDFLMELCKENDRVYFWIELKGSDLSKACSQILNTIRLVGIQNPAKQQARVITTGVNKNEIRTIEYQKLSRLMLSKGGKLQPYTSSRSETI